MDAPLLAIGCWRNEIGVPRAHPAPLALRDELAALVRMAQEELAQALAPYLAQLGDAVVLVRRLEVELHLEAGCDPVPAARVLARRVAQRLVADIESGAVLRFASRAAHAARFIADLAAGHAHGRWYHAAFDGLQALPAGAAIRTLLEAQDGPAVLAAIEADHWPAVAEALGEAEAARVLQAMAACGPGAADTALAQPLLAALQAALQAAPAATAAGSAPALALVLLAALARQGLVPDGWRVAAVELVARSAIAARRAAHGVGGSLGADGPVGVPAGVPAAALAGRLSLGLLARLAGPDGPALRALAQAAPQALAPDAAAAGKAAQEAPWQPVAVPGLVVLLDDLDALWRGGCAGALPKGTARPVLLAVLACAAGASHATAVWHDPAWRTVLGVAPQWGWNDLAARLDAGDAAWAQARRAAWAQGHLRALPQALRLAVPGLGRLALSAGTDGGLWCEVGAAPAPALPWVPLPLAQRLAATRAARADALALDAALPRDAAFAPAWRLWLMACAQLAWRRVARRVPGMAGASLPYLRANLLGLRGECRPHGGNSGNGEDGENRWQWRVARPPLHVLLALTGVGRGARLRLDGREPRLDVEWT